MLGLSAILAVWMFSLAPQQDSAVVHLCDILVGILNVFIASNCLKSLVQAIVKKTVLQGKIDDINTELELIKNEESRGITK